MPHRSAGSPLGVIVEDIEARESTIVIGWRQFTSRLCGALAAVALVGMMLITVADVVLRAAINAPIRGAFDLVELLLAFTFFMALPAIFLRDENIVVNVIDPMMSRALPGLKVVANLLAAALLGVMAWQGYLAAQDTLVFNDVTADLGLPRILHWIALLIGVIGAALAALVMAIAMARRGAREE